MEATIGFAHGEVYCINCKRKESYNALKPLSAPRICRYCNGRMTDDASEKLLKHLDDDLQNYWLTYGDVI